jgi:ribosomal protein L32
MASFSRMPRYDIRNDGHGPYAIFYCDECTREFRSQPDIGGAVAQDLGRQVAGGFLRNIPLVGSTVASNLVGEDPRYSLKMSPQQLESAWKQVQVQFRECPTCNKIVCLSDFDTQSGYCNQDTPRVNEVSEARGAQAGAALKGLASAFGLGDVIKSAGAAARQVQENLAKCSNCGTMAAPGTKFCPECGSPMTQPVPNVCPSCGAPANGAKFCPNCGTKIEQPKPAGKCPNCGTDAQGAKFCPECGTKIA